MSEIIPAKEASTLLQVRPGKRFVLPKAATSFRSLKNLKRLDPQELKERAKAQIEGNLEALKHAQELLYASDTWSVLIIFQAMDAAGKDGMIKHVMSGLNPQGCQVASFKKPSDEELDHTFLWRYWRHLPERGRFGIFNRSYYEETLVVRVHPELVQRQKLPPGKRDADFWEDRWDDINSFERHLVRNGTLILKFFLHISRAEQKKRFLAQLDRPEKHWKFNAADIEERQFWADYMRAYEDTLNATSTEWAPWYVIPSDNKWASRAAVSGIISLAIKKLNLKFPKPAKESVKQLTSARAKLLKE
jgi:PPK2 family polyphosphate:nucleotide phosphotransferase